MPKFIITTETDDITILDITMLLTNFLVNKGYVGTIVEVVEIDS